MANGVDEGAKKEARKLRVLIADDVMETRRSTRLMLTLVPDVKLVAVAHNGRQAVEMAAKHRPDIALMDVSMPEMDGVSAIEEMVKRWPSMGCIVISAERDSDTLRRAMAVGARGYLIKPITGDELVDAINRVSEIVRDSESQVREEAQSRYERYVYLQQMATEVVKQRRSDDQAVQILEELATYPDCDVRWLQPLAVMYVFRQEWGKLKKLSARLEQISSRR